MPLQHIVKMRGNKFKQPIDPQFPSRPGAKLGKAQNCDNYEKESGKMWKRKTKARKQRNID